MSRSNPLNRGLNTYIPALGNGRQRLSGDEPALPIEKTLPIALDMLRDKETRQRASGVLVRLGDPAAVALLDWVHDDDAPVREAATWTLARIKARRWVRGLLKANEWTYQHTTALPNTISYRSLTHAVAVGSVPSRAMAALALGRLGEDRALFELIELLTSQHAICRMAAIWALGRIGDGRATPHLSDSLLDPDWAVRLCAGAALNGISHR